MPDPVAQCAADGYGKPGGGRLCRAPGPQRQPAPAAHTTLRPGPTGESNRLTSIPRAPLLCLGPSAATAMAQAQAVRALGGYAVEAPGLPPQALTTLQGFAGALHWGPTDAARPYAQALAARQGPILPLIGDLPDPAHVLLERHVCIDTTASGGNAQLLAEVGDEPPRTAQAA